MIRLIILPFTLLLTSCSIIGVHEHASHREDMINLAQSSVQSYMTYKSDKVDHWDATCPREGDCEDFALCKSRVLQNMGFDKNALTLYVGQTEFNNFSTTHAVLLVDDNLVLDNMHKDVVKKDVFLRKFNPLYSCSIETGKVTVHDDTLLYSMRKYPEFRAKIESMCKNVVIVR